MVWLQLTWYCRKEAQVCDLKGVERLAQPRTGTAVVMLNCGRSLLVALWVLSAILFKRIHFIFFCVLFVHFFGLFRKDSLLFLRGNNSDLIQLWGKWKNYNNTTSNSLANVFLVFKMMVFLEKFDQFQVWESMN